MIEEGWYTIKLGCEERVISWRTFGHARNFAVDVQGEIMENFWNEGKILLVFLKYLIGYWIGMDWKEVRKEMGRY